MRTIVVPPSKTFKDAAIKASISIFIFIVVYIALFFLALGLTAVLSMLGISIMALKVSIWNSFGGRYHQYWDISLDFSGKICLQ
jgi:uncharacterized membrane protein